jgi:xylose isomerase
MMIILQAGGLQGGGINFDAKIRRNSTDPADLFYAHIGGMDIFARALVTADKILQKSDFKKIRTDVMLRLMQRHRERLRSRVRSRWKT